MRNTGAGFVCCAFEPQLVFFYLAVIIVGLLHIFN